MAEPLDAPVLKGVAEAVRALDTLHKEIGALVARLPASIPPAKAKAAAVKVHNYLKRHAPLTKLIGSKIYDALSPDAQDGLKWLGDVIADLLTTEAALRRASKTADMDFAKDPDALIKAIRTAAKDADNPSWIPSTLARIEHDSKPDESKKLRTEALVKVMQKGTEIGGITGTSISSLALLVLLHMIWKMLGKKLTGKPKT